MRRYARPALVLLFLLLVAGGWLGWRKIDQLGQEIGGLRGQVADLGQDLSRAELRTQEARQQAAAEGERADEAEDLAARLAERAERAEAASTEAEQRVVAGRAEADQARSIAEREARARAAAEERSAAAIFEAEQAHQATDRALQEAAELRRQRAVELDRLQRALGQIADTRRTALGVVMNLGDSIEFDFDRAELRPENRELLSRIAGVLLTAEDFGIQVYGHTDDVGSADYNLELSRRRADAVRAYLVQAGIPPDNLSTKGMGKSVPLVAGTDPESRQRNRRVEIAVVEVTAILPADPIADAGEPSQPQE